MKKNYSAPDLIEIIFHPNSVLTTSEQFGVEDFNNMGDLFD